MVQMRRTLLTELMMQAPYQPATNYWRAVEMEEVIQYGLPNGQGLDLGCGDGHLMAIIFEHIEPINLVGLDIDPHETALARERKVYQEVVTASADRLPFADSQFDFVFSNSVLEHIQNIEGVLIEVARVLRPGGRLIFTVPGVDFHRCLKGPIFGGSRDNYLRETDARCFHLRYWGASQWMESLRKAGLIQVVAQEYLGLSQVQRWELIARYTSKLLYGLFGKKKQPIEIQRKMHIRNRSLRLPRLMASWSACMLDFGKERNSSLYGCVLIEAKKSI